MYLVQTQILQAPVIIRSRLYFAHDRQCNLLLSATAEIPAIFAKESAFFIGCTLSKIVIYKEEQIIRQIPDIHTPDFELIALFTSFYHNKTHWPF